MDDTGSAFMKKLVVSVAVVGCIGLLACGYWLFAGSSQSNEQADVSADPLIEAAALAIKGISLMQGGKGFEYWRLKADWAAMSQSDGIIEVREPNVRYTLGEGASEDYVYALSEYGRITDQQQVLTMWGNVRLTRGEDVLVGPEMTYRTNERTVHFSQGCTITRPTMSGTFGSLLWDMNANRIEGGNGVDILFEVTPLAANMADTEAADVQSTEQHTQE